MLKVFTELTDKLASLQSLWEAEFDKEKRYYQEAKISDERYEEWVRDTHGLAPVETMPMPPDAPGIICVAEILREINNHLAWLPRLAETADRLAGASKKETT